jgi:hypothetical protein
MAIDLHQGAKNDCDAVIKRRRITAQQMSAVIFSARA